MADETEFSDEQMMFTLAMLSYLGTENVSVGPLNDFLLRTALEESLEKIEPVRNRWEVIWGPVTYAAPVTLFADSAMFVVRDLARPERLGVVIRGTNPLSAFDWVWGDIWVDRVVPWHYGDASVAPGAAVSLSSALGLSIVQNMRWFELPELGLRELSQFLRHNVLAPAEWVAKQVLSPVRSVVSGLVDRARGELTRDLAAIRQERDDLTKDLTQRLETYSAARQSPLAVRARKRVDGGLARATGTAQLDLLYLMEGVQRIESLFHPGQGLQSLLAAEARRSEQRGDGPLEVFVTGHSKGGALAPVVALWLSDTRRTRHGGWNRQLDATVHSYAFAGPTPGNRSFSRLFERTLGSRGHRISNRNDLVPHGWAVPSPHFEPHLDLLQIPDLYRSSVHMSQQEHALLKKVAEDVARDVSPLDYSHTGESVREFEGKIDESSKGFFGQVLDQHTTAYIQELGLEPYLTLSDLFTPL